MKYPRGRAGYTIAIAIVISIIFHYYFDEVRHPYVIGALILNFLAFFLLAQYIIGFFLLIKKLVIAIYKLFNKET